MIQAVFLLESSFVALTSIVVGTALGLLLGWNIIQDHAEDAELGQRSRSSCPGVISSLDLRRGLRRRAARDARARDQASRVPPAEALATTDSRQRDTCTTEYGVDGPGAVPKRALTA